MRRMGTTFEGEARLGRAGWTRVAALAGCATVAVFAAALAPQPAGAVAAVFPPWWSEARVVAAAGDAGALVAAGADAHVVVVDAAGDLPKRLREAGALVVFNPGAFAGCLRTPRGPNAQDPR